MYYEAKFNASCNSLKSFTLLDSNHKEIWIQKLLSLRNFRRIDAKKKQKKKEEILFEKLYKVCGLLNIADSKFDIARHSELAQNHHACYEKISNDW